ncbi:putative glycosyltransferase [uncultured Candidatus Thioglobus sp.]|nr:putative glycosyltransferase [uncultured Candidatus Thioglobus sp.]
MKFSILMSIYKKEEALYFDRAMRSIWDDQFVKPSEVVLVQDGPLPDVLHQKINNWKEKLGDVLKVVVLLENLGTGKAKNIGVIECRYELIAVMDTDDVSLPGRFEKQVAVFEKNPDIDVCGSWVGEFIDDESKIVSYRRTPELHDDIVAFSKSRSPVNHPTAMYKKTAVLSAGNYSELRSSQDFNLFVKLIIDGAKFYNIQESLVDMRMGNRQLEAQRGGVRQAIHEAQVQIEFYKMGFLNVFELIRNVAIGFTIRILPNKLMKVVFKLIRKL